MLAYAVSAALGLLKHLSAGVSDAGVALRVAVGCAVVELAGLVRDRGVVSRSGDPAGAVAVAGDVDVGASVR
jgi:hypothetical protein